MDATIQKKRLTTMIAIDVVCLIVGVAAIVGNVAYDIAPLLWVFVAAAVIGMLAQVWFVRGLMKSGRSA
jgi:membrane protein YdbS with pleckstrin-like domain